MTAWWPGLLAVALLVELGWRSRRRLGPGRARAVSPRAVGVALYGPYAIGVELASTLLLAALIGARTWASVRRRSPPGCGDAVAPTGGGRSSWRSAPSAETRRPGRAAISRDRQARWERPASRDAAPARAERHQVLAKGDD